MYIENGKVYYSVVKIKVLKALKPTFWYASDRWGGVNLIGQVVEARKCTIKYDDGLESVSYEYLKHKDPKFPNATHHFTNLDIVEVNA